MMVYSTLFPEGKPSKKGFAVLIDPDKCPENRLARIVELSISSGVDLFLVGGSLLMHDHLTTVLQTIRSSCEIPIVLFPGNNLQINRNADAILLLSLISGRNPELLIGRHVISAPILKSSGLEVISTGYLLIDSGKTTTVNYMSQTMPIPSDKSDIAACTAMAGEMLGMKLIYLDAGSGAAQPVPADMIRAVRQSVNIPLIIGGGITSAVNAADAFQAGADVVVVGNAIEKDPELIPAIARIRTLSSSLSK